MMAREPPRPGMLFPREGESLPSPVLHLPPARYPIAQILTHQLTRRHHAPQLEKHKPGPPR
jgi:hypothetical protein